MKLVICAGGTGGHIFPGIAVAEAFVAQGPQNEAVFVGTIIGMESRLVPKAGFRLLFIDARQFLGKSLIHKAMTILTLVKGVWMAMRVLKKEKPDAVLGMGGFTSVPVMLAAALLRIPSYLHEQNVHPGLANRFLSRIAKKTFISFVESSEYLTAKSVVHTGNPLRKGLFRTAAEKKEGPFGVFVFGGSRGARSINEGVVDLLGYLGKRTDIIIYHQTGQDDFESVSAAYGGSDIAHEVFPFTDEMEKYYNLADVVICRAGASTIFELARFKKAAVLIPYPFSANDHQWKNASQVEALGGAYLLPNEETTGEKLFEIISHLMREPELIMEMGRNIGKRYIDDAAERIIGEIAHGLS